MSYTINWEPQAVAAASRFIEDEEDEKDSVAQVLAAADLLADDPRPEGSFAYGSADVRRIHIGRYRLLHEIYERDTRIDIVHLGRVE